jgi:hypothetical protein
MTAPYLRTISILTASLIAVNAVFAGTPVHISSAVQGPVPAAPIKITAEGQAQIAQLLALKSTFSLGEQKLAHGLALASRQAHGKTLGPAANFVSKTMSATDSILVVIRGKART